MICAPAKQNKPRRIVYRKGAEHHRIDQAEDGRVGANAESEGQNGDGCEPRIPAQLAQAVAQILKQGLEPLESPGCAHVLLDLRGVTQSAAGGVGGFFWRGARGLLVFRFQLQMAPQLALKV